VSGKIEYSLVILSPAILAQQQKQPNNGTFLSHATFTTEAAFC
jgi:hypothetical protein